MISSRARTAFIVFMAWTLYGALLFSQMTLNRAVSAPAPWKPWGPFLLWMGSAWTWAALTPVVVWLVRRFSPTRLHMQTVLVHCAAVAAIHGVATLVDNATFYFVAKQFPANPLDGYTRGFAQTLLFYTLIAAAVLALDHVRLARTRERAAARLETDLARARLDTLRRQIQPHFLFNTLNTISGLIESDPARAGSMIARLGELLRRSLDDQEQELVSLGTELDFVRVYTDIERVRFESWLNIVEEIEPAARTAMVPSMILQPLVENAIKHGIAPSNRKGTITIRAAQADQNRLRLEVVDDGVGLAQRAREGIGLKATRERITQLFGEAAHFAVLPGTAHGTRVTIEMPIILRGTTNGSHS